MGLRRKELQNVEYTITGNRIDMKLPVRIDTTSAPDIEREMTQLMSEHPDCMVYMNADAMEYISSAGLRILMKVRKAQGSLTVTDVSRDVYDIMEVTGFVDLLDVRRKLRTVSVEGCELIGRGGNGSVYRLDEETILKLYNKGTSLDKIAREKKYATAAFKEGVPCAIAYDTVRIDDQYGIVFELLNAVTIGRCISTDPERLPELGRDMGRLMRQIHGTSIPEGDLPGINDKLYEWIDYIEENYLEHEDAELLRDVVRAVPEKDTLLHLDFHEGNVMLQDGEMVLIDLDDVCTGNPIYDLCSYYVGHIVAVQTSPDAVEKSLGMASSFAENIYPVVMGSYFDTDDEEVLAKHNQKMQLFSLFWLLVYLGKGKDSKNLTPERTKGLIGMILPQFKKAAPVIIQIVKESANG